MKKCPHGAEEIQEAAIKCKHCGSMLNQPLPNGPGSGAAPLAVTHGVNAPERVIYAGSPSWKAHTGRYAFAALLALGALGAGVAAALLPDGLVPGVIGAVVLLLAATGLFAATELGRRMTRYKVTSRSIDVESGLVSRRIETLHLWRVRDVEYLQSVGERLFGVARIRVITSDATSPQVVLLGLPDSRAIFDDLKHATELARQARNVIGVVE